MITSITKNRKYEYFPIKRTLLALQRLGGNRYISCSWHQTTKQPILFAPVFFAKFSQLEQLKKSELFIGPKQVCLGFGSMKSFFFSFFKCSSWEKFEGKFGKNKIVCLVVWCHKQDIRWIFDQFYFRLDAQPEIQIFN